MKPENFHPLTRTHANLDLRFMTVHGSKGLEADHVIVLDVSSGRMGFPSEIEDDPLLDLVLPEAEVFDHAEERRLFYVALTRPFHTVTILADREKPSSFVRELAAEKEYGAVVIGEAEVAGRACGKCGGRMLAHTGKIGANILQMRASLPVWQHSPPMQGMRKRSAGCRKNRTGPDEMQLRQGLPRLSVVPGWLACRTFQSFRCFPRLCSVS